MVLQFPRFNGCMSDQSVLTISGQASPKLTYYIALTLSQTADPKFDHEFQDL